MVEAIPNKQCPRCKHNGNPIEKNDIYNRVKVPGWKCEKCGYVWLKHNDLTKGK